VVVFPFASRSPEVRIFAMSLAQAVVKGLGGVPLEGVQAAKRPFAEDATAVASDAAALGGALAVIGEVGTVEQEEVRLSARLIDVAAKAEEGVPVETRIAASRIDEGASVLAAALRARALAWLGKAKAAERATLAPLLVYGVDVPLGPDGADARVAATRAAYKYVRREFRCRPVPAPTYGIVATKVAALQAAQAGCRAAIMVRVESLWHEAPTAQAAQARVFVRMVSADGARARDRVLSFQLERKVGETREALASRAVTEALRRLAYDLRTVVGPLEQR